MPIDEAESTRVRRNVPFPRAVGDVATRKNFFPVHFSPIDIYTQMFMDADFSYDLTVATVCRNALKFLPRCIASVHKLQGGELKVEHLLIDGASTDGTREYLQEQAAQGLITRLISEPDKGLYDAMNKAIAQASGKVIVFINADDEICAEAVPACCRPILQGDADYAVAGAVCVYQDREVPFSPCLSHTLWRQPYCHQSMYCSTQLLREIGGFHWEQFRIGADTELMRRLYISEARCTVVPVVASRFYDGGVSSTPSVVPECYRLMLHFAGAYRREVARHPLSIIPVIKYIRRYAARSILQEGHEALADSENTRLRAFITQVVQDAPRGLRGAVRLFLLLQAVVYHLQSMTATKRRKPLYALYSEINRLFARSF